MPINIGSGTGNVTYSNGNFYDSAGNIISGVASYTWAQFTAGDFDLTDARHIVVTDKHSSIAGYGGSLWYIDPSAPVEYKRQLRSECIVTTWANRPAAASYPGIVIKVSDYMYAEYYSDGTNYRPVGAQLIYHGVFGTLASPTCTVAAANTKFTIPGGAPTIPAGMVNSTSRLRTQASMYKVGANGTCQTTLYFGTSGDNTDLGMSTGTIPADTASHYRHGPLFEFTGTTSLLTTYNAIENSNGGTGSFADRTTHIDVASAMIYSLYTTATYTAGDTIALQQFSIWHEA